MKRTAFVVATMAALLMIPCAASPDGPPDSSSGLLPRPISLNTIAGCSLDAGALDLVALPAPVAAAGELVGERWRALGLSAHARPTMRVQFARDPAAAPQAYTLDVSRAAVRVRSNDDDGAFYALVTLGQMARRDANGSLGLPCGHVVDAPALRWRILSDDVSRGPLPTMRYFEERIRTIAAFKMNGYSPYMEHVFVDPRHPLPAPLDGITPDELTRLATYARRFHVAFVPEQQTFAHMHETLKYERYAPLAELPHGYLLAPANPGGAAYVRDLIADELRAVPRPPFFHIGSDEPSDLGRGASAPLVAAQGEGPVYARHVIDTAEFVIAHDGGRPMIWDDALARHPELFAQLPKSIVFVNWHYGTEATYEPYIARIARGGFDQMVAPGALNWNEIYPDLDRALTNIGRFVTEGKDAHVLGLFQTVWHDDGETLFEATWVPVVYAAVSGWEAGAVERERFMRDFPFAFFGTTDVRYAQDLSALSQCRSMLRANPREYGDYLFWTDPFAPDLAVLSADDLSKLRLTAETAEAHLRLAPPPPLHANAAQVMAFAARRYDALGRSIQIARESRGYYDDAVKLAATPGSYVYRDLFVSKYLLWEMRDTLLALEPLHRHAWEYENRSSHEASVLERYRVAADRAIVRSDRVQDATYAFERAKTALPPFDDLVRVP